MTFRFDDISSNSSQDEIAEITSYLLETFPDCDILYAISPIVHGSESGSQRIFPKKYSAMSDHRIFYNADKASMAFLTWLPQGKMITTASHGLLHIDHRLLSYEAQEMSILTSCSLTYSKIFVPPFNKWNQDTEAICCEHEIELIKFEDGWRSMEHEPFDPDHDYWYLHHWNCLLYTSPSPRDFG